MAGRTLEEEAAYWRKAYWDHMYCRGPEKDHREALIRENAQLKELNYEQASRIMELEFLMSFITFNPSNAPYGGNGVLIERDKMWRFKKFIEEAQRQALGAKVYKSLADSKWSLPPDE